MTAFRTSSQVMKEVKERTKPDVRAKGVEPDPVPARKVSSKTVLSRLETGKTPDKVFITEALSDGRATVQDWGVNNLIIDYQYQARINRFDPGHVKDLAEARDINGGQPLYPVVGFLRPDGMAQLADGFHRAEENRIRGCKSIRAFVVDVPDWEHQARLFAAMCNQSSELKRSREDIRKAIEIICADPECASWTNQDIAVHCGTTAPTVFRVRQEWAIREKRDLPKSAMKRPAEPTFNLHETGKDGESRKMTPKAVTAKAAQKILLPGAEEEPKSENPAPPLHNTQLFKDWLLRAGIIAKSPATGSTNGLYLNGLLSGGRAITLCHGTDINDAKISMSNALILAFLVGGGLRATVVVAGQGQHGKLYDLAAGIGVDFLEPAGLVAALSDAETE